MEFDAVFEGGGVKGIALVGALKRAEEQNIAFKRVAGTSAGAIVAALCAAEYKAGEIKEILWNKDFSEFADLKGLLKQKWYRVGFEFLSLFFPRTGYGVFSTDAFYSWIKDLLGKRGITTFASAKEVYLRVFAVDVVSQELLRFDKDVTPDWEIADAVRMSMSIPLFFRAKVKEKAVIVDGGVLANYPIATFGDQEELVSTIGFKLISKQETLPSEVPKNILAYIMRIVETMQVAHERVYVDKAKWARTIPIPTGTVSTTKFDMTDDDKTFLWDSGYTAAVKAIDEGLLTAEGRGKE